MARGQLILDRYEPLGTAGAGGFGTVQIAWDPRIQRKVAIKTVQLSELDARRASLPGAQAVSASELAGGAANGQWRGVQPWGEYLDENPAALDEPLDPAAQPVTALANLPGLDEARTAAKLADPRIVTVYDFEVRGRTAYLIMEYVEGLTLTKLLARHGDELTLDMVAAVFDAVAGALAVAHKAGVLHLDIKPDNIIITPQGKAKVTDFGLATLVDASGGGTAGGGTIGYMPLEQMRREQLDVRTDEWSLASVAYEMLSGENPFRAPDLDHAEKAIEDAELVLPSLCWERIDEQVDDVIFYALDPESENRYATVADFAEEMDKFLGDAATGEQELATIVSDDLGFGQDGEAAGEGWEDDAPWEGQASPTLQDRWRQWWDGRTMKRTARMPVLDYRDDAADSYSDDPGGYDDGYDRRSRGAAGSASLRRFADGRLARLLARVLVACLVGYLAFFAVTQFGLLTSWLGEQWRTVALAGSALIVGLVGLARPHVGVLIAGLLVGFVLVMGGHTPVGAVFGAVGLAWCLAYPRLSARGSRVLPVVAAVVLAVALVAVFMFVRPPAVFIAPAAALVVAIVANALLRR